MTNPILAALRRVAVITAACLGYALTFNWFFAQNQIGYGGVTGIAQIINALFGILPVGVLIIIINLPLFLLGWRLLGWAHVASSLLAMFLSSVFIDLTAHLWPLPPMDPLLACLFGGAGAGLTLGIIFMQNATTGGTDLAARLIQLRLAWVPIAKVLLVLDFLVISFYGIVFRHLEGTLYGLVSLYVSAKAIDIVLYGMDTTRVAYIISTRPADITAAILAELDRGVTLLHGTGGWSGEEKQVLFVAFKQRQIVKVRGIIKALDPNAFVIVCPAHEVLGEGFRGHDEEQL